MLDLSHALIAINQELPLLAYLILMFIIFAESGLFFGFFFPGDSLLVIAGLLASQGIFNLPILLVTLAISAIGGYLVGYIFGKKIGQAVYHKQLPFLNKKHILKARDYYKKHGTPTLILARFIPIVRTFVPIVAGVANMEKHKFLFLSVVGGVSWVWGMLFLGFFLGNVIPDVEKYLLPIIGGIVIISLIPAFWEKLKHH